MNPYGLEAFLIALVIVFIIMFPATTCYLILSSSEFILKIINKIFRTNYTLFKKD